MKPQVLAGALLLVMAAGLIAGCTEIEETIDPDLKMTVIEVVAKGQSPAPTAVNASEGNEFLYIKINITNDNEKADHTIWNADRFSVDDNSATQIEGGYLANLDSRTVDSLIIDTGEGKTFWVVFEVPSDMQMLYIRYDGGLDEPLDNEIPAYEHYSGDI